MPLPCPAPAWTTTLWPARVSSSTPTGSRATRYSSVLISLGTPTIIASPPGKGLVHSEKSRRVNQGRFWWKHDRRTHLAIGAQGGLIIGAEASRECQGLGKGNWPLSAW